MTLCVGWIGECPVHEVNHGCEIEAPHAGGHQCQCGSAYGTVRTVNRMVPDDKRKNQKRHPDHYKPKYLLRKEGKL